MRVDTSLTRFWILPSDKPNSLYALIAMITENKNRLLGTWVYVTGEKSGLSSITYAAAFARGLGDYLVIIAPNAGQDGKRRMGELSVAAQAWERFVNQHGLSVLGDNQHGLSRLPTLAEVQEQIERDLLALVLSGWVKRYHEISPWKERV